MYKARLNKAVSYTVAGVIALGAVPALMGFGGNVSAAGVLVAATPNEVPVATATDVTFTYTASNAVEAIGTTYTFVVSPALTGALANCTPTADAFADANGAAGAGSFSGFGNTGASFLTTTLTATTGRSFCLKLPTEALPISYSFSIISSTGDFGAALVHIGDNNDVNVTAVVGPTLSFNIRNATDTLDINTCDLGSVDSTTVVNTDAADNGNGECQYALAIGSNSNTGFSATQDTDTFLDSGANTMTYIADNAAFVAGVETYGLANVTAAAGITEAPTPSFTFGVDASPLSATPVVFLTAAAPFVYTVGGGAGDTTIVTHGLTVGSGTETGAYTQLVTYQVTSNF